jgi:hypothetical protein
MACQTIYAEMMSLHLDGQLDDEAESRLLTHVVACGKCAPFWDALMEADTLFLASALEPVPVPQRFSLKVMARIAVTPATRQQLEIAGTPEMAYQMTQMVPALPILAHAPGGYEPFLPVHLPDALQQVQKRASGYLRGAVAAWLTATLTIGLLLALVVSGVIQVGGPFAPFVEGTRTFLSAAYTWARTLVTTVGVETVLGGAFLFGLLAFAGWQIVSGYQRAISRQMRETARVESVA